jgi:transcriptional regulator with AAA-type ATPase domain
MELASVPAWADLSSFKTPLRVLAQHFLASRERWKAKSMAVREQAKRFRTESRDLRRSREHWKRKAQALAHVLAQERRGYRKEGTVVPPSPPSTLGPPPAPNARSAPALGPS